MHPMGIRNAQEMSPWIRQVTCIVQQRVPVKIACKQTLPEDDRLIYAHLTDPGLLPGLFWRFYDKCAGVPIKCIRVCLKPSPGRLFKGEGKRIEVLACS